MTAPLTAAALNELERLLDESTSGPWASMPHGDSRMQSECWYTVEGAGPSMPRQIARVMSMTRGEYDATLIVALRNAAPALIEAARERDRLREKLGPMYVHFTRDTSAEMDRFLSESSSAQDDRLAKLEAVAEAARHAVIGGYVASEFDAVRAALAALGATGKP